MTHLYQQPFYVISYATSALAALELLEMAQENRDQALDAYMEISASGTGTAYCQGTGKYRPSEYFSGRGR